MHVTADHRWVINILVVVFFVILLDVTRHRRTATSPLTTVDEFMVLSERA
jgi:hypothetical protein